MMSLVFSLLFFFALPGSLEAAKRQTSLPSETVNRGPIKTKKAKTVAKPAAKTKSKVAKIPKSKKPIRNADAYLPLPAAASRGEAQIVEEECAALGGVPGENAEQGSAADCVTDEEAIDFVFAPKWEEALGRALHQGRVLGKIPSLVLILENQTDQKYVNQVNELNRYYRLKLRVYKLMTPELKSQLEGDNEDLGDLERAEDKYPDGI